MARLRKRIAIGLTLRSLRVERGLTLQRLAERIGSNKGTISAWEHGAYTPTLDSLVRLAAALGVRVEELVAPRQRSARASRPRGGSKVRHARSIAAPAR
jgi:transcriptional regulator with XRE-family HTH domain